MAEERQCERLCLWVKTEKEVEGSLISYVVESESLGEMKKLKRLLLVFCSVVNRKKKDKRIWKIVG